MSDYNVTLVCTVTDPDERRSRLARAYDILLGVANRTQQRPGLQHDATTDLGTLPDDETSGIGADGTRS